MIIPVFNCFSANLAHRLHCLPAHTVSERKAAPFLYITKVQDDDEDRLVKVFVNQAEIKMSATKYIKDPRQVHMETQLIFKKNIW